MDPDFLLDKRFLPPNIQSGHGIGGGKNVERKGTPNIGSNAADFLLPRAITQRLECDPYKVEVEGSNPSGTISGISGLISHRGGG